MANVAPVRDIDRGFGALLRRLATGNQEITVGIHAQDGDVVKKGADGEGVQLIDVALAHEFGLGVPRRSFIADWQDENVDRHKKQIQAMAKAVLRGTVPNAEVAAARLANLWVGEVQKRIAAGIPPALHPKTIARKKSSTPLIDTGQLRSSVAYALNGKLEASKAFETITRDRVKATKRADRAVARAADKERKALKKSAKKAIVASLKGLKKTAKASAKAVRRTAKAQLRTAARTVTRAAKKARKTARSAQKSLKKTLKPRPKKARASRR